MKYFATHFACDFMCLKDICTQHISSIFIPFTSLECDPSSTPAILNGNKEIDTLHATVHEGANLFKMLVASARYSPE